MPPTTVDHSTSLPTHQPKSQRVLACLLCQQRKVKCDRKFPCANCTRFKAQCIPALAPRPRRRRFPERELLDRIRKYEDLLRQNNVKFEPLHKSSAPEKESPDTEAEDDSGDERHGSRTGANHSSPSTSVESESNNRHEVKGFWDVMRQAFRDPNSEGGYFLDDASEEKVKKAWDQLYATSTNKNMVLFGWRKTTIELSALHPEPVQIFRLWQVYLNNVDPLLKVTHTPSLQGRLVEAAGSVANISPTLEALMFSIYCMSVMSLTSDECVTTFGSSKADLLDKYQLGCQQALSNCGYLRTKDRECLTAVYLFMVSVGHTTDPQTLSSMLGIAVRIAHRMGIHSEAASSKVPAVEAEMRRRLWWALKLFDARIGELATSDYKDVAPAASWDAKIPLNLGDSELLIGMKDLPPAQSTASEAVFAVVRSELAEFARSTHFHKDFPSLSIKNKSQQGGDPESDKTKLSAFESMMEQKYLQFCNPENPLHFMTIWTARTVLARYRLLEHYSRFVNTEQTEPQRDLVMRHAIDILECDTKVMASPLTKGYLWLAVFYFPLPAYIHILHDMKRRPGCDLAERAWEAMSDNIRVRVTAPQEAYNEPVFAIFTTTVLPAWEAREELLRRSGHQVVLPSIVSYVKEGVAHRAQRSQGEGVEPPQPALDAGIPTGDWPTSMPMGLGNFGLLYGSGYAGSGLGVPGQAGLNLGASRFGWAPMDWDFSGRPSWF